MLPWLRIATFVIELSKVPWMVVGKKLVMSYSAVEKSWLLETWLRRKGFVSGAVAVVLICLTAIEDRANSSLVQTTKISAGDDFCEETGFALAELMFALN